MMDLRLGSAIAWKTSLRMLISNQMVTKLILIVEYVFYFVKVKFNNSDIFFHDLASLLCTILINLNCLTILSRFVVDPL